MLVGDSFSPVPAGLRPLANFGYTRGHVPMWGSFAQDRGSSNAPYDDQRGANRLFGGTPDIGAVEAIDNQAPSFSGGGSVTVKPKGKQVWLQVGPPTSAPAQAGSSSTALCWWAAGTVSSRALRLIPATRPELTPTRVGNLVFSIAHLSMTAAAMTRRAAGDSIDR